MMKIEKATIKIKGKTYNYLKPRAVDMIDLEDRSLGENGQFDMEIYSAEMIKLVSPTLTVEGLVDFKPQEVTLANGEIIIVPEMGYSNWKQEMTSSKKFSRVELAKKTLRASGVEGNISLDGFKYEDIDNLATAFYSLYDSTELNAVIEEISTTCF
ncbi:MAG: hypothetical protein ACRC6E_11670 [Fusobacteriaceae bacterium]